VQFMFGKTSLALVYIFIHGTFFFTFSFFATFFYLRRAWCHRELLRDEVHLYRKLAPNQSLGNGVNRNKPKSVRKMGSCRKTTLQVYQ